MIGGLRLPALFSRSHALTRHLATSSSNSPPPSSSSSSSSTVSSSTPSNNSWLWPSSRGSLTAETDHLINLNNPIDPNTEKTLFSSLFGFHNEKNMAMRRSIRIYGLCCKAAEHNGFFSGPFQFEEKFADRFTLAMLHIWLATQRYRFADEKAANPRGPPTELVMASLSETIWTDVTRAVANEGVHSLLIDRHIRKLYDRFFATSVTFEQVSFGDDTDLVYGFVRNIWGDQPPSAQAVKLAVDYVRANLAALDRIPDKDVLQGIIRFDQSTLDRHRKK